MDVNVVPVWYIHTVQALISALMHGRDLVSVNEVSDALAKTLETKTLTVLFMDLNQGFVGLLCSGKIVLVLH